MNHHNFSTLHLSTNKKRELFFVKDAIYGEINFFKSQIWLYELINTFEFQRLAKIKQLGFTCFNFPCATHSRLSHSLGVYELTNKFINHFLSSGSLTEKDQHEINIAYVVALLHDIGHGPFSHASEKIFDFCHEDMTQKIISSEETKTNYLLKKKAKSDGLNENFYVDAIISVFKKEKKYPWIEQLISSDVDVDRLDYFARDRYFSGASYGGMDCQLLMKWSTLINKGANKKFLFFKKAEYLIFNFLIGRQHMYLELYTNPVSLIYEKIFMLLMQQIKKNFSNLIEESDLYKEISFLIKPSSEWTIQEFLSLNDEKFLTFLDFFSKSKNPLISSISNLFLGNEGKTEHKCLEIKEMDLKKYQELLEKWKTSDEDVLFFEKISLPESNIKKEFIVWNHEEQKEEKIPLLLNQDVKKSFYMIVISKKLFSIIDKIS